MLRDLREVYVLASGVSVDWGMLGQAAQGARQRELLELAERCHPATLRIMRWANASTQALIS